MRQPRRSAFLFPLAKTIGKHSVEPVQMLKVWESNRIRTGEGYSLHKTTQSDKWLEAYELELSVD